MFLSRKTWKTSGMKIREKHDRKRKTKLMEKCKVKVPIRKLKIFNSLVEREQPPEETEKEFQRNESLSLESSQYPSIHYFNDEKLLMETFLIFLLSLFFSHCNDYDGGKIWNENWLFHLYHPHHPLYWTLNKVLTPFSRLFICNLHLNQFFTRLWTWNELFIANLIRHNVYIS